MKFNKLSEQALAGKRVLIRVDMNVPVKTALSATTPASAPACRPSSCA